MEQYEKEFEQRLARLMPLPPLPASLAPQAVAEKLAAAQPEKKKAPALRVWRRAALAAAAAVAVLAGVGFASGLLGARGGFSKSAAPEGVSEETLTSGFDGSDIDGFGFGEEKNDLLPDENLYAEGASRPLALTVSAGAAERFSLGCSFAADAAVRVSDPESGEPLAGICAARLDGTDEAGSVLAVEGISAGQALVCIEDGVNSAALEVTVTEAAR